jgi:death-on-curing protein
MDLVLALHKETLALFGGMPGVRDRDALEMALNRPQNKLCYKPETGLFDLAAAYGYGIVQNHPFIDGNKRVGALCVHSFLFLNGYTFQPDPVEYLETILGVAQGKTKESQLAAWLRKTSTKRK